MKFAIKKQAEKQILENTHRFKQELESEKQCHMTLYTQYKEWQLKELERISKLKINVPEALQNTYEQASETTEPKTKEKDEPAEIDGVEYILVTAGAPGTGNPHIDDAVKLYNRLGESSSVLYGR